MTTVVDRVCRAGLRVEGIAFDIEIGSRFGRGKVKWMWKLEGP